MGSVKCASTLSWGRHDISFYPIKDYEISQEGEQTHYYEICWCEYAAVGRVSIDPKPYLPGAEDKLRYQTVFFTFPNDAKGTSFLNIWEYDQIKFTERAISKSKASATSGRTSSWKHLSWPGLPQSCAPRNVGNDR